MLGRAIARKRQRQAPVGVAMVGGMLSITLAVTGLGVAGAAAVQGGRTPGNVAPPAAGRTLAQLPLTFERNVGQAPSSVKFLTRNAGITTFLTTTGAVTSPAGDAHPVRMDLVGGNPAAPLTGLQQQVGIVNYFVGRDPSRWHSGVPTYASVLESGVYPGIDLVYHGNDGRLEYDFRLAPDADPAVIRLGFDGARSVSVDPATGDLLVASSSGLVRQHAPTMYQAIGGAQRAVRGGFAVRGGLDVGFNVGAHDTRYPLVIDPVLAYSSLLGGSGGNPDLGNAVAVDRTGSAYVAGFTGSLDFPTTPGAFQTPSRGMGSFVTKFNPTGTALVYSTYLGGTAFDVIGATGIAVDAVGDAYVIGTTNSTDFPVTAGAFQTSCGDCATGTVYVSKLSTTGSALVYSTFLGGTTGEFSTAIALDQAGEAYVTGNTSSADFPVTAGAFQTTCPDCATGGPAFVTKLNPSGSAMVYSTFLGSPGARFGDVAFGIAVDAGGNAYLTGDTSGRHFPTTRGALATACPSAAGGCLSGFVTKLNPAGSGPVYSTYLGGTNGSANGGDAGRSIAVDATGNAYVAGTTQATDFPVTARAFQRVAPPGTTDGFMSELNAAGARLLYSTYIGGNGQTLPGAVAVDAKGRVLVAGTVTSTTFQIKHPVQKIPPNSISNDAFVARFDVHRGGDESLLFASHLGSNANEQGVGIAVDSSGSAYVTGFTQDTANTRRPRFPFPTTPGAFQRNNEGGFDAFLSKISFDTQ